MSGNVERDVIDWLAAQRGCTYYSDRTHACEEAAY